MRRTVLALAFVGVVVAACGNGDDSGDASNDAGAASTDGGSKTDAGGGSTGGDSGTTSSGSDASSGGGGTGSDASSGGGGTTGTGNYMSASEPGIITYYDATGAGACSFDATPDDLDVAAMDAPEYDNSAVCGECVAITGPKGNLTVRVVDLCPECEKGHLDLSQEAFAKLADVSLGHVAVTWKVVECAVKGNLGYNYKDGVSQYWFAVQVTNSRLPIAKLEIEKNGTFTEVERESYNYFVDSDGSGTGKVTVRVTSIDGQQLIDTLPPAEANVTSTGAAQFQ
jgi:expansin (peptidoglycan-binding protein)